MRTSPALRAARIWALAGLILLTVNLRAAITCIAPLLTDLQHTFHLGSFATSLLTTLPVLCLGVFAALAPPLSRRIGTEGAITLALALITTGILLRTIPSAPALFAGTVLAGAGIAIGNVMLPAVVKQHFAHRVGSLTGVAMTLMAASGAVAAGLAVPLDRTAGWRIALAVWAIPSAAGTLLWGPLARPGEGKRRKRPRRSHGPTVSRSPLAWAVAVFLGLVSLTFYVLVSWLPEIMQNTGVHPAQAGTMMSVMLLIGIPMGYLIPVLAARLEDQKPLVITIAMLKISALTGILLVPGTPWLWVILLGLATGSAFPLAITLLTLRSPDPETAAQMSGMAQTSGYLLAGAGPLTIGLLHSASGGWTLPLLLLLGVVVPEAAVGMKAARNGFVVSAGSGAVWCSSLCCEEGVPVVPLRVRSRPRRAPWPGMRNRSGCGGWSR
ncbi:CynX/NimT family MFS transporter [Streptomyces sp. NPDC001604]|uniref:CynX/NimT family MFS transporter n=1 Tax=Streptomyces sp. NPDC001604 TaxID=3364593 RepID=UPI0036A47D59